MNKCLRFEGLIAPNIKKTPNMRSLFPGDGAPAFGKLCFRVEYLETHVPYILIIKTSCRHPHLGTALWGRAGVMCNKV